jgi:hypothetical protein
VAWRFETLGNAMVQVFKDDRPILVTDPWLAGSAYFGSWELERPLTDRQLKNAHASPYIWYSHGHPDHFHIPSLERLSPKSLILLPDHYDDELARAVAEHGFSSRILPNKKWMTIEDGLRVLCVANENMDAILAIDAGGTLILDKNDSPFCGEDGFFRKLVHGFPESYLLQLCAFDADMLNLYDSSMEWLIGPPAERKPGTVWATARICNYLGVTNFCMSSSQHVYARPDSVWANDYRTSFADLERLWVAKKARLIGPFKMVDLATGRIEEAPDAGDVMPAPRALKPDSEDDWAERLTESDWSRIEQFVRKFDMLTRKQDFVAFTVGGETRRFFLRDATHRDPLRLVGVNFHVPKKPLLETIEYGYIDDLMIGNFMKTQLFNMELYPHFTPLVAKIGGNAKVFTRRQLYRFWLHFFLLSPVAFLRYRWQLGLHYTIVPAIKKWARALGVFSVLKQVQTVFIGAPKSL